MVRETLANAICRVLPIARSTYHHHQAVARDPSKASLRAQRDAGLAPKLKAAWEASGKRYGAVKVWYDLAENNCSIPDDHISPRRSALFMARSVLRDVRDEVRPC